MTDDDKARLARELEQAEADVERIRAENAALADDFRADPSDDKRELLKRAAASLAAARDRVTETKARATVLERTGSIHGLIAEGGEVFGSIAIAIAPGTPRDAREKAIDAELADRLHDAASSLGCVLGASPSHYTRERPGRDEDGRTILDVVGRVEGDVLVPAVSRSARLRR